MGIGKGSCFYDLPFTLININSGIKSPTVFFFFGGDLALGPLQRTSKRPGGGFS